jgi:hypothetical protein
MLIAMAHYAQKGLFKLTQWLIQQWLNSLPYLLYAALGFSDLLGYRLGPIYLGLARHYLLSTRAIQLVIQRPWLGYSALLSFGAGLHVTLNAFSFYATLAQKYAATVIAVKSWVVNTLPTRLFVRMAQGLPMGHWLEYERPDDSGSNSVMDAIKAKDALLLERILKVASPLAIERYLSQKNWLGISAIFYASDSYNDTSALLKLVLAAVPEAQRADWLMSLKFEAMPHIFKQPPYMFDVLASSTHSPKYLDIIMQSLPQKDKLRFLLQRDAKGNSLLIKQSRGAASLEAVTALLSYFPLAEVVPYLKLENHEALTALYFFATQNTLPQFKYLLSFIADEEMKAYLIFTNQGVKALLKAHAYGHQDVINLLQSHEVELPEPLKNLRGQFFMKNLLDEINKVWSDRGAFITKYGRSPFEVLEVRPDSVFQEIKKARKRKLLQVHSDKNNNIEHANEKTQAVTVAFNTLRDSRPANEITQAVLATFDSLDNTEHSYLSSPK